MVVLFIFLVLGIFWQFSKPAQLFTKPVPWKVFMITSSNGNIFRVTGHMCGEFTGNRWIPAQSQWRRALIFSLICAWLNGWVNICEAGDLRHHRAHYGIIVLLLAIWSRISIGNHSPINSLAPGKCSCNIELSIFPYMNATEHLWWQVNIDSANGPDAVRQQAISLANVGPDLCHHMASPSNNELKYSTSTPV